MRLVRTPDGRVSIDETGRLSGRGAYLCRDAACWRIGLDKGTLSRALETALPPDVRQALEAGATMLMNEGGARGQE